MLIGAVVVAVGIAAAPCDVRPHVLRGDVDGDGRGDRIAIAARSGPSRCHYALVVRSAEREYRARLPVLVQSPTVPQLVRVARLGSGARAEIVVSVDTGASTAFLTVYTLRRGVLRRMWIRGSGPALFAAFGSVAHPSWVDCDGGAIVAASGEARNATATKWAIGRTIYRVAGLAFAITRRESFLAGRWLVPPGPAPFSRCPTG